jgi:hypothetical protein
LATKSTLKETEAVFKIVSSSGSKYTVEITDTGYINGKYWKIGEQFKITSTLDLSDIKKYEVFDITEVGDVVEFGLIKEVK